MGGRKTFREFLQKSREKKGYSIRALAKYSDVSNAYISQIERGIRFPSAEILKKLAGPLRISEETLMRKAGYLPEKATESQETTLASGDLLADLNEEEKKIIIDLIERLKNK